MDELFELLFKYRPFLFAKGSFAFLGPLSLWMVLLLIAVLGGGIWYLTHRQVGFTSKVRSILWVLRTALVAGLLLMLAKPTLSVSTLVPKQTALALLVDTSRSMGVRDADETRSQQVSSLLAADGDFIRRLAEDFQLRFTRFDEGAASFESTEQLSWDGNRTLLSKGLTRILDDSRTLPFGGVVLITDGSDQSPRELGSLLEAFSQRRIPIHTVGVGLPELPGDIEVGDVILPDWIFPGSSLQARVPVRHVGRGGAEAVLEVREGATLVHSTPFSLPRDSSQTAVEISFFPEGEGIKEYSFSVKPLEGEPSRDNNTRRALLEVRKEQPRVLLVEGRPRWEYKFIRQALREDESIRFESLLRTAINKYYRQGIEEESTLATGFPSKAEDLFEYSALILGDVESAFFDYSQLEMIREFVGRRGGGLLMLGGASALAAGGYANTPVEAALPVWLGSGSRSGQSLAGLGGYVRQDQQAVLTRQGADHPALALARTAEESRRLWREFPALTDLNGVGDLKTGATVLASAVGADSNDTSAGQPLMVSHRYGRGLGLVFLSGSSWRWQMLKDHEDQSFETFWRQLIRWLVRSAEGQVAAGIEQQVFSRGQEVPLRVHVHDSAFQRVNSARVEAEVTAPSGEVSQVALHWDSSEDGLYTGTADAGPDGLYRVRVSAVDSNGGRDETSAAYGFDEAQFLVRSGENESFNIGQNRAFLEAIARQTGGNYYEIGDSGRLPDEVVYSDSEGAETQVLELWDMPFNFILLLSLLFGEWVVRKREGAI